MLVKWLLEQTTRREAIQEWIPKFFRSGIKKRHLGKELFFYLWKVFFKRKRAHFSTPIITLACTEKRILHYLGGRKHQNVPKAQGGCSRVCSLPWDCSLSVAAGQCLQLGLQGAGCMACTAAAGTAPRLLSVSSCTLPGLGRGAFHVPRMLHSLLHTGAPLKGKYSLFLVDKLSFTSLPKSTAV